MKVSIEIEEVNFNVLNKALADFSNVLNGHLVTAGNKIYLHDDDEGDFHKHNWLVKVSIEWYRKPK